MGMYPLPSLVGGRLMTTKSISPLFVCCSDLKSGSLCEYAGGPKVGPLPSQFFHFFIVEIISNSNFTIGTF
jgi:hypothetical protein